MLKIDPSNTEEIVLVLKKAVKQSGMTLAQLADLMEQDFGEKLIPSALSSETWWKTISLQQALQILDICGVSKFELKLPVGDN